MNSMKRMTTVPVTLHIAATALVAGSGQPSGTLPGSDAAPSILSEGGAITVVPRASRDDVASRIQETRRSHAGLFDPGPVSVFDRAWQTANDRLEEATGLRFGMAYTLTFQAATSGPGDRSGAAGDLDLLAAWRLVGEKDGADVGTLYANAQHIHSLGEVDPANLASEIGAVWATSDGIGSDESFPVVQFYYEQALFDDGLMFVIGKIDTSNYVNTNRYADDSLFFMNRAFSSNPALNYPGNGLGAVLAVQITDQFYIGACIADANGVETQTGFDSIDQGEFFTAAEFGFTLEIDGVGDGNYRVTVWHSDEASEVELPEDFGFCLSVDQEVSSGIVPFFRYGWSDADATGIPNLVAGGVAFEGLLGRDDDVAGLGLSWGESADEAFTDQVAAEAFYRLQVTPSIQCTLGAQAILNALHADSLEDELVGVVEMRLRVTF